jgi:hypothetical protein
VDFEPDANITLDFAAGDLTPDLSAIDHTSEIEIEIE